MLTPTVTPNRRPAVSPGVSCERRVIFPTYHSSPHHIVQRQSSPAGADSVPLANYRDLKSPSRVSVRQRPTPKEIGVNHEYRNHLLSNFAPESNQPTKVIRACISDRPPATDDICIGLGTATYPSKKINKKRSSVLPKLPPLKGKSAGTRSAGSGCATQDEATVESNGTSSTDSTTSTRDTTTNDSIRGPLVVSPISSNTTNNKLQPSKVNDSPEKQHSPQQHLDPCPAASPFGYRSIVGASPHQACGPAIVSKFQIDALARLPLWGPVSPPTATESEAARTPAQAKKPLKSILREKPRYAVQPVNVDASIHQSPAESTNSVPSLVDINNHTGVSDDDEEEEDDILPDCQRRPGDSAKFNMSSTLDAVVSDDLQEERSVVNESSDGVAHVSPGGSEAEGADHHVSFDPRVWVREFHRDSVENTCTWYTNEDMERFKRLALDRILRYQSRPSEIIATGTVRVVQRALPRWSGPVYAHPSLTLDGENDNDKYLRRRVLEKELRSILIVDPHDLSLKLFTKSLKRALPRTAQVTTATSSDEVLKLLQQGQRFDMIIVEERLQLFHRHHSSSSASSSTESSTTSDRQSRFGISATKSSGAALIETLSKSSVASNSLFIGVSAHMLEDEEKLRRCGADFCWSKPPPPIDQTLVETLAKSILEKRGRDILAAELFE